MQICLHLLEAKAKFPLVFGFIGPKGVGKSTLAYQLAEFLLCENRRGEVTFFPVEKLGGCKECLSCRYVAKKEHPDLLFLEPKGQNIRIGDVKILQEKITLLPAIGKWKVVLIFEGEKLNMESSNALLKTLEEPPPHLRIFFITHREKFLPATLASRLFKIYFPPLSSLEIADILKKQQNLTPHQIAAYLALHWDGVDPLVLKNWDRFQIWLENAPEWIWKMFNQEESSLFSELENIEKSALHQEYLNFLGNFYRNLARQKTLPSENNPVFLQALGMEKAWAYQNLLQGYSLAKIFDSFQIILESRAAIDQNASKDLSLEACWVRLKKIYQGESVY